MEIQHNIILALRAHNLMFRDQDYVVTQEGEVMIVDEVHRTYHAGKTVFGRTASGDRSKRACEGQKREQDTGNYYIPEPVQQV